MYLSFPAVSWESWKKVGESDSSPCDSKKLMACLNGGGKEEEWRGVE